jgi:hypothetical protein
VSTEQLLTLLEAAKALRLSPHTIRSFVRKRKLCPVRLCRRLLFRAIDVESSLPRVAARSNRNERLP